LQQLNPLALITLRETSQCEFALPEVLFDMGYPGNYMRRIKSVALTFACVVGPQTSLNCVLRLQEHEFRTSAIATSKNHYPKHTDETDERFSTVNVPITSIAVSTGQADSGVFELNFRDERYIPFEGAGPSANGRSSYQARSASSTMTRLRMS
jgi:Tc toxin complex TcA C-terminal TcB-binding domain